MFRDVPKMVRLAPDRRDLPTPMWTPTLQDYKYVSSIFRTLRPEQDAPMHRYRLPVFAACLHRTARWAVMLACIGLRWLAPSGLCGCCGCLVLRHRLAARKLYSPSRSAADGCRRPQRAASTLNVADELRDAGA